MKLWAFSLAHGLLGGVRTEWGTEVPSVSGNLKCLFLKKKERRKKGTRIPRGRLGKHGMIDL